MPGTIEDSLQKVHVSLNVANLERSIAFYRVLLGSEPAKVRSDYAKFEIADPALVLSLAPGTPGAAGNLNHAGIRVRSADELVAIQHRLEAAGLATKREDGVECCYSRQTKFWVTDPDRALWEIYILHDDVDDDEQAAAPQPVPLHQVTPGMSTPPQAWEHHLRDAIPSRIPHEDNTLHEIRLEGSINVLPERPNRAGLLGDALRALRPGGALYVHGLSGDRSSRSRPSLPGAAADVEHVPATGDVVGELARAGFAEIQIETLSERPYFTVDGVPMRELRVKARKPGHRPRAAAHQAVYLGPMQSVTDDFGNTFSRGVATTVNIHDWQALSRSVAGKDFLLLAPDGSKAGGPSGAG